MSSEKIYRQYLKDIYRYCFYKLNNKEDAEDIASETFTKLLEQKNISKIENVKAWMILVARNMIFNKYKKESVISNLNDGYEHILVDENEIKVENQIIDSELIDIIKENLDKLDSTSKEVVILKVWEDLKFTDISEILKVNENTVKTIYYQALKDLKHNMETTSVKKGITAGSIIASIAALKSEISASEEFIASQISQASNLIINSSNMNTSVSLLSKLKTIFAANPIVGGGAVVGGVSVIAGVAVVVTSVLSPVTLGPNGEYQSNGLLKNYSATINFKNENTDETFNCNTNGCDAKYSNYGIPDGEYDATIIIKNMFGQEVGREEKKVTVDSVSPKVEITYPEFTNKSEVEIKITSDEEVKVYINNEEKTLTDGIVKVNVNDGANNFSLRVVDKGLNEITKDISITLDTTIDLNITTPQDGAEVDSKFTVSGTTDAGATVSSQGVTTVALEDGTFTLELTYSTSKVDVTSTDKAGNTLTKSINVKSKGPTTLTYTGKYYNFTFNYSSSLGTPTSRKNGNYEEVKLGKITIITHTYASVPSSFGYTDATQEPFTTNKGVAVNLKTYKVTDPYDTNLTTGNYVLNMNIGSASSGTCVALIQAEVTPGQLNSMKATFRSIAKSFVNNFQAQCL